MAMHSKTRLIALWACVGGLVAACGGGSDGETSSPPPAGTPGSGGGTVGGGSGTPPAPPPSGGVGAQAPTVTLTSPVNFTDGLTGTISLTATATDNVGVAGVEFQVDGVAVGAEDTTAPYSVSLDTADFAAGQHIVRARARDTSNNRSTWGTATVRFGGTAAVAKGFSKDETWITGLTKATSIAQAPDGRLFIAEQGGAVRVVKNGTRLATPFTTVVSDENGERGAIGIALHPQFASNNYVYVHYTTKSSPHGRISRFTANGDVAVPGSEEILFELPALSSATNHNGGAIHFGADGKLYVGVGDNADGSRSPLLTSVFGKILRINDNGSIPTDNPHYATTTGLAQAIWARGLRNPFTFAVQPTTGTLYINDVGENTWEEVNVGAAGANYGWPATEGDTTATGVTAPVFSYRHEATVPPGTGKGGFITGQSIVGGTFYPSGGTFPVAYQGSYFFADFLSRIVGRLDPANGHAASVFANMSGMPVDVLAGNDGALYVLYRGSIARITAQ